MPSDQFEIGELAYASGASAQAVAHTFFDLVCVMVPEQLPVLDKDLFQPKDRSVVRRLVNASLKKRLKLSYEEFMVEEGFVMHYETAETGSIDHRFEINIKSARHIGTVESAWYASHQTVELHLLRAFKDLSTAHQVYSSPKTGLFLLRPFDVPKSAEKEFRKIDELIENTEYSCASNRFVFRSEQDPEALAEHIAEFTAS
jgi:hypothetical protein